jgi:hypothetical protein
MGLVTLSWRSYTLDEIRGKRSLYSICKPREHSIGNNFLLSREHFFIVKHSSQRIEDCKAIETIYCWQRRKAPYSLV